MRKLRERMNLSAIARDTEGVAAVEFALVAPVFLLLVFFGIQVGLWAYGRSVALAAAREALGRGELLMIFPEGTYTRDPDLWPMQGRLGAARLALETGAPLLPIASWGARALWPVGSPLPRPGPGRNVRMLVGEPYTVAVREGETVQQAALRVTDDLMLRIAALLGRLRGEEPPAVLHDPRRDTHRPEVGRNDPAFRPPMQEAP